MPHTPDILDRVLEALTPTEPLRLREQNRALAMALAPFAAWGKNYAEGTVGGGTQVAIPFPVNAYLTAYSTLTAVHAAEPHPTPPTPGLDLDAIERNLAEAEAAGQPFLARYRLLHADVRILLAEVRRTRAAEPPTPPTPPPPIPVAPGVLIRRVQAPHIPGYVVRWPKDRSDWTPHNMPHDEWVVCWFYTDGPQEELTCAGDFTVVGTFPAAKAEGTHVPVQAV